MIHRGNDTNNHIPPLGHPGTHTHTHTHIHIHTHTHTRVRTVQVGACIVDRNKVILGIGYNGFPRGCADGSLPWSKKAASGGNALGTK
jgi:deoxycytidylate deaminase